MARAAKLSQDITGRISKFLKNERLIGKKLGESAAKQAVLQEKKLTELSALASGMRKKMDDFMYSLEKKYGIANPERQMEQGAMTLKRPGADDA